MRIKFFTAIVLALCCSVQVGSVGAAVITVDGVMDGNDAYTDMLTAKWVNEHAKDFSIYADGTRTTDVYYLQDSSFLYLYMEVPIYAKNMVWGTGCDDAACIAEYTGQFEHHGAGSVPTMDFNTATGSEKELFGFGLEFSGYKGELKLDAGTGQSKGTGTGLTGPDDYATSLDWLLDAGTNGNTYGCDTTDCAAADLVMSFEWKLNYQAAGPDGAFDPQEILDNLEGDPNDGGGIQFHLSPERDAPASAVPIPASAWLFGSSLGLLGWVRRRITRGEAVR
jgi:hypothetical protein